jgi:hypothetical protein
MEGIMNLPANVGGATSQDGLDSFAPLIAAQSAARDIGYPRFTRELLSAGSEIDQAEVQEFLQEIRNAGIGPEELAVMRRVVEAVFNDPNNYPQVRGQLLAEGVPEDILPETFDLEFFVALRMATEEAENLVREPRSMDQGMPMEAPVGMAEGGIVGLPQMTPIAREMAAMGRNGDTMLAHITPQEAMMLQRMGGSGTINPYTGLPEFFLKKLGRGISKAFKSVGRAVKKFASSKVGRIITTVALGAFLGPAAAGMLGVSSAAGMAAVGGFVGSFGSGMLAGDGLQNSLRSGLTGAALAGGLSAISGGSAAMQARPEFKTAYGQRGFFGTVGDTTRNFFGSPVDEAKRLYGTDGAAQAGPVGPVGDATAQLGYGDVPYDSFGQSPPRLTGEEYFQGSPGTRGFSSQEFNQNLLANKAVDPTTLNYADQDFGIKIGADPVTSKAFPQGRYPMSGVAPSSITGPELGAPFPQSISGTTTGAERGFIDKTMDFLSPSAREAAGKEAADRAFQETLARTKSTALAEKAYQAALPGTISKYAPIAATGIGTLMATGVVGSPFEVPEQEPGESYEAYMARRDAAVAKFRQERPEFYGSFLGPSNQGTVSMQPSYSSPPIITAATGSGPQGVENFPRKNGAINGPGTGTSDDIPAMLSDGEFVFTAKSVRNMGGGSRRKGAAKMYKLMKMLEGGPVDKTAKV